MGRKQEGFTLIELLVVVIVVGILAAIAIPLFMNQRAQAYRVAAEADLRNIAIQVESFGAIGNGFPADQATFDAMLMASSARVTQGVVRPGTLTDGVAYTLQSPGYCLAAGHVGINGGATVVAAYAGTGPGLMANPTVDCT